jgi:hypothetical protein
MNNFQQRYHKFFGIAEIENSFALKLLFACIVFSFFSAFNIWIDGFLVLTPTARKMLPGCPGYFSNCKDTLFYQLTTLESPYHYLIYIGLFALLVYAAFAAMKGKWQRAHQFLLVVFTYKFLYSMLLVSKSDGADKYDMLIAFCFLFLSNKLYFARVVFVMLYFISSIAKMNDSWILGNFWSLNHFSMPFVNGEYKVLLTNFVIFQQVILCWLLFSNKKIIQKPVLLGFHLFHLASGLIIGYRFMCISVVSLIALFGKKEETHFKKIDRTTIAGYLLVICMLCGQLLTFTIPGDYRKTGEGTMFGIYLFNGLESVANKVMIYHKDGTTSPLILITPPTKEDMSLTVVSNDQAMGAVLSKIRKRCKEDKNVARISWQRELSMNGDYFELVIDEPNACNLKYKQFSHNKWLKIDGEAERLIQKPATKHPRYENPRLLKILHAVFWTMWVITLLYLIRRVIFVGKIYD